MATDMAACGSQRPETYTAPIEGLTREPRDASQRPSYFDEGHSEFTLKTIFGYCQAQKLCDITLIAGGCRIPAHKILLASCSDYFAVMLCGSLREARLTEITLECIDSRTLQDLVNYCYTGTLDLRDETVEELLATASLLQMGRVTRACCSHLEQLLDPCNCLGVAAFAERHSCIDLRKTALKYTYEHISQVAQHQEFLALQAEELANLLKPDDHELTGQDMFESLMTWVQHDSADREPHLITLLKIINLRSLPTEYLKDNVERECGHVPECHLLVTEAMTWQAVQECQRRAEFAELCRSVGRLCVIGGNDLNPIDIETYEPDSNSWIPVKPANKAIRRDFGSAVLQNQFIIAGGGDDCKVSLNTALCLDLTALDGEWRPLPPMTSRRTWLNAAALGACVYAVGRYGGSDTVERWDATSDSWTFVTPMSEWRDGCGVAALRGRLYAVGGSSDLRSVECYDPSADRWYDCAPMIHGRCRPGVCADGNHLYVLGGIKDRSSVSTATHLASVERYDPVTDTWALLTQMSCARAKVASCVVGDKIVAVGGTIRFEALRIVEVYDMKSECWHELKPLNTPRYDGAVVPLRSFPTPPTD